VELGEGVNEGWCKKKNQLLLLKELIELKKVVFFCKFQNVNLFSLQEKTDLEIFADPIIP